jgi:DNA-directed RNA polymerase subunit RPC12/RpoP
MARAPALCSNQKVEQRKPFIIAATAMSKTRLYIECPRCSMQYMVKDFSLTYSNGAYIEDSTDTPQSQVLICPCRPGERYKFKLK